MVSKTTSIGAKGEDIAVEWLRERGYMIVVRNWRCGRYELDIVAQKGFSLHIVEVKTRHKSGWTTPEEAMDKNKCKALLRASNIYLSLFHTPLEPQIDLIAIDISEDGKYEVRYLPNAVVPRW